MAQSIGRWLGWAVLAAVVGTAAFAGANWRVLRDGWRLGQIRSQPGYPALKARWQRIAVAAETLRWPEEKPQPGLPQQLAQQPKIRAEGWPGGKEFAAHLKAFTDEAEWAARCDFDQSRRLHWGVRTDQYKDTPLALRELAQMRAAGRLSDGTFARAMLVLARHESCFIFDLDADSRRVGLMILGEMVDDGAPRVAHAPARSLQAAIEDAAHTRTAANLCLRWKQALGSEIAWEHLEQVRQLEKLREMPAHPLWERDAFRLLAEISSVRIPAVVGNGASDAGWGRLLPLAAEEAVGNRFVGEDEAVRDFDSPRPPTREQVVNLVESEAARLPEELRRPFFGVVRMYLNSGHTSVIGRKLYGWEPGTDRQSSPTLRLIVEIIRVWG